jgi:hypothetical protein
MAATTIVGSSGPPVKQISAWFSTPPARILHRACTRASCRAGWAGLRFAGQRRHNRRAMSKIAHLSIDELTAHGVAAWDQVFSPRYAYQSGRGHQAFATTRPGQLGARTGI